MKEPSFWKLVGAYSIDFTVTSICVWYLWSSTFIFAIWPMFAELLYDPAFFIFVVNLAYFSICEGFWGKTLGKKCFQLQVIGKKNLSFIRLLTAYGFDFSLFAFPALIFSKIYTFIHFGGQWLSSAWHMFGFVFVIWVYFICFEFGCGGTFGKLFMNLRVMQKK